MSLKTFIDIGIVAELVGTADLQRPTAPGRLRRVLSWDDTTADLLYTDTHTLAASGTQTLTLSDGSLSDALGNALVFARVTALLVVAAAPVQVTRPTNGVPIFLASGDGVQVPAGSPFAFAANDGTGWAVTADTADEILFTNPSGSASCTYSVALAGKST